MLSSLTQVRRLNNQFVFIHEVLSLNNSKHSTIQVQHTLNVLNLIYNESLQAFDFLLYKMHVSMTSLRLSELKECHNWEHNIVVNLKAHYSDVVHFTL